jgi:biotin carboxyl carrier protein
MEFSYEHDGEVYRVEIVKSADGFIVKLGNRSFSLMEVQEGSEGLYKFQLNRTKHKCRVATSGDLRHVFIDGNVFQLKKVSARSAKGGKKGRGKSGADDATASGMVQSPINGKIIKVWVEESSGVSAEQDLIIIEAMKMEHRIKSPFSGTVKKINVKEGEQVELGSILIELEKTETETGTESE